MSSRLAKTSNCSCPTAASTGEASPQSGSLRTCTTPSSLSWSSPLRNCLVLPVSTGRAVANTSGAKAGIAGNFTGGPISSYSESPMFRPVALTRPTTSPGKASSTVVRSAPNTVDAYLVAKGFPVRSQVITMPRSNLPEQMRAKAIRSRWLRSMLACTLNTNAEHGSSRWRGLSSTSRRGDGAGARSTIASRR